MTTQGRTPAPPRERETHVEGFTRLKALRLSLEKTLAEMAAILDATPDVVIARAAIAAPVGGYQRREA